MEMQDVSIDLEQGESLCLAHSEDSGPTINFL